MKDALQIEYFPDELIEASKAAGDPRFDGLKYWLLGALQSIQLHRARETGSRFWSTFPDVVYSDDYMATIMAINREGKGTVLLSGFKANRDLLTAALAGAATVSAPRLIELALTHIHEYYRILFVKPGQTHLPRHTCVFFNCGNTVRVHSPHHNIAMIDAPTLQLSAPRFYLTLDASIEKISPLEGCHFHRPEDRYFATELAGDEPMYSTDLSEPEYINHLAQHSNRLQLDFYRRPYILGVAPGWAPDKLTNDAETDAYVARISERAGDRPKDPALQAHLISAIKEMTRRATAAE